MWGTGGSRTKSPTEQNQDSRGCSCPVAGPALSIHERTWTSVAQGRGSLHPQRSFGGPGGLETGGVLQELLLKSLDKDLPAEKVREARAAQGCAAAPGSRATPRGVLSRPQTPCNAALRMVFILFLSHLAPTSGWGAALTPLLWKENGGTPTALPWDMEGTPNAFPHPLKPCAAFPGHLEHTGILSSAQCALTHRVEL